MQRRKTPRGVDWPRNCLPLLPWRLAGVDFGASDVNILDSEQRSDSNNGVNRGPLAKLFATISTKTHSRAKNQDVPRPPGILMMICGWKLFLTHDRVMRMRRTARQRSSVRIRIGIPFMCQTRCQNFSGKEKLLKKVTLRSPTYFATFHPGVNVTQGLHGK